MKKTFNINIGNSIVHIEEDAYEVLTVYLTEVKQHFAKKADDFEIVTDIENRIAEMFAEILDAQEKQVINISDVQSVMQQMGSVKDFETSEEALEEPQQAPSQSGQVKKLYRDTDQAVIAGVCRGLAHYLNVDVRWVRVLTFLTAFLSGAGVIAYIILWIMVPRAQSRAEKMEMHGQEANLRGFANSYLQPFVEESRGFIAEFFHIAGNFIQGTGKVFFKFIAAAIIVFGSLCLLILITTLAAFLGFWDSDILHSFPVNIVNEEYLSPVTFAAFIILAIPVLALILFSVRVAFNSRPMNKTLSFGLLIIWLGGVMTGIFYVAKISSEFKEGAEFAQETVLKTHKEYILEVDRIRFFTKEDSLRYRIDASNYKGRRILNNMDDEFDEMLKSVSLRIEKSNDGKASLSQNYKSRGKTFEMALKNAQHMHYDFLQRDSTLNFSPVVHLPKMANWRGQEVELTLYIPVGTGIRISRQFNRYLNGYGYWDCDHDEDAGFSEWAMTDGGLKCNGKK